MSERRNAGWKLQTLALWALVTMASTARAAELLAGATLTLRARPHHAQKRALKIVTQDAHIALGQANGSVDDPVLHGGSLRLVSVDGDFFDQTYGLASRGWRYLGGKGNNRGYVYRGGNPVRSVLIRPGKVLRVLAKGGALEYSLATSPAPVQVVLTLGGEQYCFSFGDTVAFVTGNRFVASAARAPEFCPLPYGDDALWLCRPGMANNQCFVNRLDATEIHTDLSQTVETHVGVESPPYDCFYIYPTVDLASAAGNHTDFSDITLMLDPLVSQASRFDGQCRIFAPLYRQVTLGTFGAPNADHLQDLAYQDVRAAWRRYLKRDNGGRNVVIMGHSQGSFMTRRLLQEEIDPSPELRARLIAALLIGGDVAVPVGGIVGGSFKNIPLCRSNEETGCVIAYRSFAEGFPPAGTANGVDGAGLDLACTNPAALAGGEGAFSGTYLPTSTRQPLFNIRPAPEFDTPFILYRNLYAGECVKDAHGHSYLEIRVRPGVGDLRTNLIPFDHPVLAPSFLGTHILDYNWALGDLLTLVATKAAHMP